MVVNGLHVTNHAQPNREETLNMKEPLGVLEVVPTCNTACLGWHDPWEEPKSTLMLLFYSVSKYLQGSYLLKMIVGPLHFNT